MRITWKQGLAGIIGFTVVLGGDVVAQQAPPGSAEAPAILNSVEMAQALHAGFPEALRRAGVGGTVRVQAFINAEGRADSARVAVSSGIGPLDAAATSAVRAARFETPSLEAGVPGTWFDVPVPLMPPADEALPVPPLRERDTVLDALQAAYPRDLARRGYHATVVVLLEVGDDGAVVHADVPDRGCFPTAPSAALEAARAFAFEPATSASPTRRRFPATIAFAGDTVRLRLPGDPEPPRSPPARDPDGPQDGPSARPEVRNQTLLQQDLIRRYPAHLRNRGIGGEARVWLSVDERGRVTGGSVGRSSGHCELDLAALEVGSRLRFTPAIVRGQPTAAWVEIPFVFSANR